MLRFRVFENGEPAGSVNLRGACLLGGERVPIRAELRYERGELVCQTKERGAVALAIQWPVRDVGRVMLETPRLLPRKEPYNLHVELARGQLMRISQKREDWGLYEQIGDEAPYQRVDEARDLLIDALTAADDASAVRRADEALTAGVKAGEAIGAMHAELLWERRRPATGLAQRPLGCRLPMSHCDEDHLKLFGDALDFAAVVLDWRSTAPQAGKLASKEIETCLAALRRRQMSVHAAALFSFDTAHLPAWLPSKVKHYDQLCEAVATHLRRLLPLVAPHVQAWEIASGLNASNPFKLSYAQIVELARVVAMGARHAAPRVPAILTICHPWGEYYASNSQTILPMLFAESVMQTGVPFDAFGLDVRLGGPGGAAVRDMMQISALLDRLGNLGKPVHVSAAGVPSADGSPLEGSWRGEWSPAVQAEWLRQFYRIALSKPFVETVTWRALVDSPAASDLSGLVGLDLAPKPAYLELTSLRREVIRRPAAESTAEYPDETRPPGP